MDDAIAATLAMEQDVRASDGDGVAPLSAGDVDGTLETADATLAENDVAVDMANGEAATDQSAASTLNIMTDAVEHVIETTEVPASTTDSGPAAEEETVRDGTEDYDPSVSLRGSVEPSNVALSTTAPAPSLLRTTQAKVAGMSRVAQLTARVEKDPFDGEAQLALLHDAEQKGDLERTREVYENFLKVFPDAARYWIAYCDLELSHGLFDRVQDIFIRCLRPSCSVSLWKFYLDFVRRRNPIDLSQPEAAKQARATISKSFEFALQHIGQDREAGTLWTEYLEFLKEGSGRGSQWEDQQRMDALRKVYQSAVQIPVENVEQIWQEYNSFENNLSKVTAKKFLAELSPAYMTARKALREIRAQFDRLAMPELPHRPVWSSASSDRADLELWKRYLAWEESNPLDLEDPNVLHARIAFAYKKAVANMRFFSEIWYLASMYHNRLGKYDEAKSLLESGLSANPGSLLLGYTLSELEEGKQNFEGCYKIYDALIDHFQRHMTQIEAETNEEVAQAQAQLDADADADTIGDTSNGDDDDNSRQKRLQEKEETKAKIEKGRESLLEASRSAAANVWITEMRFARRAEGVKQSRSIFAKARKSPYLSWQVIEASARLEYYWNNEVKIATNVFELGLKSFSKDPDYVLQYLDFLIATNNPNNARALFERTVILVEPVKAKAVWDRMAQYEYRYGDYLAAQKIFKRYSEAFPDASYVESFARRYGHLGLESAISSELGTAAVIQSYHTEFAEIAHSVEATGARAVKREASVDQSRPGDDRETSTDRADWGSKRLKTGHKDESPAPSDINHGVPTIRAWGRAPRDATPEDGPPARRRLPDGEIVRRRAQAPSVVDIAAPALNRAVPFKLDARGDAVAVLPDAVVFFLSILPNASTFTGPFINPATMVDVIATTILPGTAPGPGLPGERLGIPPRPKPAGGEEDGSGRRRRGGRGGADRGSSPPQRAGGRGEPDYSYGAGGGGGARAGSYGARY